MVRNERNPDSETVALLRAGSVVTNLLSSFGHGLKETRLTAALGYMIALRADSFRSLLRLEGDVHAVSLEHFHDRNRSDIQIETSRGEIVVEAKTSPTNPVKQARKYRGVHRILLTPYRPSVQERAARNVTFVTWNEVASVLRRTASGSWSAAKSLSTDIIQYLEENRMIPSPSRVEIYAREINEPTTLQMFLRTAVYGCDYQVNSRLAEARYFAPHFGALISTLYPGIHQGISYVAQVEAVQHFGCWDDFKKVVSEHRSRAWFNKNRRIFEDVRWLHQRHPRVVMLLSAPRLVFNPAVRKENLQEGRGWLSKRFLTFEDLFKAWGR